MGLKIPEYGISYYHHYYAVESYLDTLATVFLFIVKCLFGYMWTLYTYKPLQIIGSTMTVDGRVDFENNNAENVDGGALYLTSYSQVVLRRGAQMNFVGNRGSLGSAIVVEAQNVVNVLSNSSFNPQCFLRYDEFSMLSPLKWTEVCKVCITLYPDCIIFMTHYRMRWVSIYRISLYPPFLQVSINFSRNAAIIGPVVYANELDLCSWIQLSEPFFNRSGVWRWPFVHTTDDNLNLGHSEEQTTNSSFYIQTPPVNLKIESSQISASPGQPLQITARTFDELGNPTSSVIRLNDLMLTGDSGANVRASSNEPSRLYSFEPNLIDFEPKSPLDIVTYAVSTEDFLVNSTVNMSIYDAYFSQSETVEQSVSFTAETCPPGFILRNMLDSTQIDCQCDTFSNQLLIACETSGTSLILSPHVWSAVLRDSNGRLLLTSYRCPKDYCKLVYNTSLGAITYSSVFVSSQPDTQCACNRSGVLCGDCPKGLGFSALQNRCVTCENFYIVLIFVLFLVDILVCIGILLLSKSLPVWVYPCLFYVQVAPYIAENFQLDFSTVRSVLYYVSSALSLYFPYDFCLYKNMSAEVSYLLRYLPLFTVIPTGILALRVKHKKLRKFLPTVWYGVWTLIILMYTQVVYTSMSILNCPVLHNYRSRWYVNGNVECFRGGHAPLAILAILVLLFAVLLIPFIAVVSWKTPESSKWWRIFLSPLTSAFKSNLYWWGSVELARRFLLLLFTIPFPGVPIAPAFVLMISTALYLFVQPYRSRVANSLETILSIDILVLLFMASNGAITEDLLVVGSTQLQSSTVDLETCPTPILGVTRLTALLTPFYYLPLFVLLCGLLVATVHFLW